MVTNKTKTYCLISAFLITAFFVSFCDIEVLINLMLVQTTYLYMITFNKDN